MKKQVSPEGLKKIKKELEYLKNIERKKIAERLKKSIAFGDLSENSEYAEAKDAQAFLECKIAELENLIGSAVVVSGKAMKGIGQIGSTILVQSKMGKERFKLVGAGEVSPLEGKISTDSLLGKSFLNKPEGAIVIVVTQQEKIQYKILKIN